MTQIVKLDSDYTNEGDFVLLTYWQRTKNEGGKVMWTDEENSIAEVSNKVVSAVLYHHKDNGEALAIALPVSFFTKITSAITEIESVEIEPQYID